MHIHVPDFIVDTDIAGLEIKTWNNGQVSRKIRGRKEKKTIKTLICNEYHTFVMLT